MTLRYHNEIEQIEDCPSDGFKNAKSIAFHFVFFTEHNRNFLPAIKKTPSRKSLFKARGELCRSYSLSMFKKEEQARAFHAKLKEKNENIGKQIGDYIAKSFLEENDGLMDSPRKDGHFSFFPYKNTDLSRKFTIVGKVYE